MGVKEDFLREYMEKTGISQADISRKTNIPPGTISGVLRNDGLEKTSYGNVKKICEALNLSVDDLDRVGPDGKLAEKEVEDPAPGTAEPVPDCGASEGGGNAIGEVTPADPVGTLPETPGGIVEEGCVTEGTAEPEADDEEDEDTGLTDADKKEVMLSSPIPQMDAAGYFACPDREDEGMAEVKHYVVMSRMAACREDDIGKVMSVLPVSEISEYGLYAVRLPESRMLLARKVWRMDNGNLLVASERYDFTPRIIREGEEGFSVVGKIIGISEDVAVDDMVY